MWLAALLLGVPARSYVRTLVQYNAMSVLFLVTRPIMSGVPIFNQMRGRFTLLLYYVALSLCAPVHTDMNVLVAK